MDGESFFGWLCVVVVLVLVVVGIRRSGHLDGLHEGKWRERCRHLKCDQGLAEWANVNQTDACVCVRTAK